MAKIIIDNRTVEVENGLTILQACESIGIEIPRFCYHERLSIAGNCRMCLVEMENSNKPVASCAMPVSEGMNIKTQSKFVEKARNGVMEFLLINHPLDCPICDQGGECDLQDQAMAYGKGFSRFIEDKRAVKEKNLGPLIKTHMTRCIHCTRCVRFAEEVAGVDQLGTIGRGEDTEITTFLEKSIDSEMSANIIDLCPVGALTSKPYAYIARPWELKKTDSIDLMDAVGSSVRFDTKGDKIMRVLPRINESINEEWISDKTRFAYDGLLSQRLNKGYLRINNKLVEISNNEIVKVLSEKILNTKKDRIGAILGNIVDCETVFSFKSFLEKIGCFNFDCRQDNAFFIPGDRSSYIFNSQISAIEDSDLCLLIGSDPKIEAPILNARIRKQYINTDKNYIVGKIGATSKLNYKTISIDENPNILYDILDEKHSFSKHLKNSKNPLFIVGQGALCRNDSKEIFNMSKRIYEKYSNNKNWNGFNVLQTFAGRAGSLDVGFYNPKKLNLNILQMANKGELDLLYLFEADEINLNNLDTNVFVVYHGHHGDYGAQKADLIIPSPCYTEKEGIFVNIEGRPQISAQLRKPLPNVNESWLFFNQVCKNLNLKLDFKSFTDLRNMLFEQHPHLENIDSIKKNSLTKSKKSKNRISNLILKSNIENFYMTDSVSRLSKVMASCLKNKR